MPDSLIIQLQKLASSENADIASLLRKAMLVAGKLALADFRSWIDLELNGYECNAVPDYRKARAEVKLRNPYHGYVPLVIEDGNLADSIQRIEIRDPIGNLVHLLQTEHDGRLIFPLSDEVKAFLMRHQGRFALPPVRFVSSGALASVIDCVRTKILDWSIELESNGILGEGMSFTVEEKQRANTGQNINIQNFQGILGNVDGENKITQNLDIRITSGDFDSLANYLASASVPQDDISELRDAIESDPKPTSPSEIGPETSNWIGKMVSKAASGSWDVSVGAAGNLLATAIQTFYGIG